MGGRVVNSALARPNDFSAAAIIDVSDSASAHCGVRLHCDEIWPSRWRMDRLLVASPVPARVSADPDGGRHAEPRHPVEHIAPDLCLGLLIGQSSGLKSPTDDGLVAKHRCFNQTPAIVT